MRINLANWRRRSVVVPGAIAAVLLLMAVAYATGTRDAPHTEVGIGPGVGPSTGTVVSAPDVDGSASASSPPAPAGTSKRTSLAAAPRTTTRPPRSKFIQWLREYTPSGGGDADANAAYIAFMQRDCDSALQIARGLDDYPPLPEPFRSLFEGAGAACLAAFDGRTELWRAAIDRLPAVDPGTLGCWDREVYVVFKAMVDAYRDDQQVRFTRGTGSGSSCPEINGLEPDHGPRSGGYPVTFGGRNLPPTLAMSWDDDADVIATRGADGRMTMIVPAAESRTAIQIKIPDAPRLELVQMTFWYDD